MKVVIILAGDEQLRPVLPRPAASPRRRRPVANAMAACDCGAAPQSRSNAHAIGARAAIRHHLRPATWSALRSESAGSGRHRDAHHQDEWSERCVTVLRAIPACGRRAAVGAVESREHARVGCEVAYGPGAMWRGVGALAYSIVRWVLESLRISSRGVGEPQRLAVRCRSETVPPAHLRPRFGATGVGWR
jgi:hypothetical protein